MHIGRRQFTGERLAPSKEKSIHKMCYSRKAFICLYLVMCSCSKAMRTKSVRSGFARRTKWQLTSTVRLFSHHAYLIVSSTIVSETPLLSANRAPKLYRFWNKLHFICKVSAEAVAVVSQLRAKIPQRDLGRQSSMKLPQVPQVTGLGRLRVLGQK